MNATSRFLPPNALFSVEWLEPGVLYCRPPDGSGEGAVRDYYDAIGKALGRSSQPFVIVSDNSEMKHFPSALERKLHGDLASGIQRDFGSRCIMAAVVIPSPIIRSATTAVMWILRPSVPVETFPRLDAALERVRGALAKGR